MESMTIYKPGDIVEIPFPFIDMVEKKLRPALVLSNPQFQRASGACIFLMVTSAERSHWDTDIELEDWQAAGLLKPSIIRWKIFTLDEQLIRSKRGSLSDRDQENVSLSMGRIFSRWFDGEVRHT